ncbi:hypothetical protein Bbelb_352630 [Branchiostoma belcheri]|nr:hypothetical protein Bbelb_352630 [Branchiostoma belcheri]
MVHLEEKKDDDTNMEEKKSPPTRVDTFDARRRKLYSFASRLLASEKCCSARRPFALAHSGAITVDWSAHLVWRSGGVFGSHPRNKRKRTWGSMQNPCQKWPSSKRLPEVNPVLPFRTSGLLRACSAAHPGAGLGESLCQLNLAAGSPF